jgi:hypothetical protein
MDAKYFLLWYILMAIGIEITGYLALLSLWGVVEAIYAELVVRYAKLPKCMRSMSLGEFKRVMRGYYPPTPEQWNMVYGKHLS